MFCMLWKGTERKGQLQLRTDGNLENGRERAGGCLLISWRVLPIYYGQKVRLRPAVLS